MADLVDKLQEETLNEYSKDMVFAYIAGSCAGIIDYWAKSGYKEKEEAIAAKLTTLASSTINSLK